MSRVIFQIDKEKDIDNWYTSLNSKSFGVDFGQRTPSEVRENITGKSEEDAKKFLDRYLEENYYGNYSTYLFIEMEHFWRNIEKEVFRRLEKITKNRVWPEDIMCYYTSFPRAPFSCNLEENQASFFMFTISYTEKKAFSEEEFCRNMTHEIFHLQFIRYFWKQMKELGLSDFQIGHIREAVTVLINEEMMDIFKTSEDGYEKHKGLREDIANIWKQDKDFAKLLESASKLIREKYSELK
jgi:hypothetical protein